ncbi:hypothetical protein P9112_003493 [Eukaryota sp. TZLM1-RC]
MSSLKQADSANVKVVTRCRPLPDGSSPITKLGNDTITIVDDTSDASIERSFQFDKVFPPQTDQQSFFNDIGKELCDVVLNGFNACMIAYGQTSSGKTYSLVGENDETRGILPLSCEYLFEQALRRSPYLNVTISISILEIFINRMVDLGKIAAEKLSINSSRVHTSPSPVPPSSSPVTYTSSDICTPPPPMVPLHDKKMEELTSHLTIREGVKGKAELYGLEQIQVSNVSQVSEILAEALSLRHTAHTLLNSHSSRSHLIISFTVSQSQINRPQSSTIVGKFSICDLAGSERIKKSHGDDVNIDRRREAASINSSLSTLGSVVSSLASNTSHVPFRDSKLTRVLQCLGLGQGGNSYITLLATLYPLYNHFSESLNTMVFANRCLAIQTGPTVNYNQLDELAYQAKLKELQQTIVELTSEVNFLREELKSREVNEGQNMESERVRNTENSGLVRSFDDDFDGLSKMESKFQDVQLQNVNALVKQAKRTLRFKSELAQKSQENSRLFDESRSLLSQQSRTFKAELESISERTKRQLEEAENQRKLAILSPIKKQKPIRKIRTGDVINQNNDDSLIEVINQRDAKIAELTEELEQTHRNNQSNIKSLVSESQKLIKMIRERDRLIADVADGHLSEYIHFGGTKGKYLEIPDGYNVKKFYTSDFPLLYKLIPINSSTRTIRRRRTSRPQSASPFC